MRPDNEKTEELDFSNRNDSPREVFPEIEEIKKTIKELKIFERPKIAKEKYNNYIKKQKEGNLTDKEIKEQYIKIYELLLLNDTDKDIVKLYLDFIEQNNDFIKKYKRKNFEQEKKKYKILFEVKEWKDKLKSEKDNFIDYLINLSEAVDYKKIFNEAKEEYKNIYHFNYPIEFSNSELFYYKLYILLISEIAMKSDINWQDYIIQRKQIAKMILEKNILNETNIINYEDKMNILIILIVFDELDNNEESINFNRLLYSDNVTYNQLKSILNKDSIVIVGYAGEKLIINDIKKNAIGKIDINHPICLKNIKNNVLNDYNFFKPIDELLIENDISLYIKNIKLLLIKFIKSKVYRKAIKQLFSSNSQSLLSENALKDLTFYINERIKFYPYQSLKNSGLTDKYSLYTYIPIIFPFSSFQEPIYSIFKISGVFENSIHEINDVNQDMLYFKSNDVSFIKSPKREGFRTGQEGGSNLEEILFGRKILNITLLEALYIINEKNFEQNLIDYKTNFESMRSYLIPLEVKKKYLKIDGIFCQLCSNIDKDLKNANQNNEAFSMNTKNQNSDYEFYFPRGKCCMGFP